MKEAGIKPLSVELKEIDSGISALDKSISKQANELSTFLKVTSNWQREIVMNSTAPLQSWQRGC
jgi:hypothetical protein